jgi:enoyl-CoA hydratase
LILKGAGRAFSAGVDLKAMNESLVGGQFTSYEIIQEGNEIAQHTQNDATASYRSGTRTLLHRRY